MEYKKIVILISVIATSVCAQSFDVSGLGLANNGVATGRGLDAFWRNPANLGYEADAGYEIAPFTISILAANNSLSLNDYSRYFTKAGNHGQWSNQDKQDVLKLFPAGGLRIDADVRSNLFNMTIGSFGFGASLMVNGGLHLKSKKALEIALKDLTLTENYAYKENDIASGGAYGAIKISAGYGKLLKYKIRKWDLDRISVGVKLNYYIGLAVVDAQTSDAEVQRSASGSGFKNERLTSRVSARWRSAYSDASPVGNGFGVDIGASAVFKDKWHFSLLFENLGASISWKSNTKIQEFSQLDTLFANGDSSDAPSVDTSYATGAFTTNLPSYLVMGAKYNLWDNLSLLAQWRQSFTKNFGEVLTPQIGVAVEYFPLPIIPIRSGITLGGRDGFVFAIGSGVHLKVFEWDISYAMRNGLLPTFAEGAYLATGVKFRF